MLKFTTVSTVAVMVFSLTSAASEPPKDQTAQDDRYIASNLPAARILTLQEAIRLALASDDPYLLAPGELAASFDDRAIADSQLPDPKFRVNVANLPLDSLSYSREPMTQLQLGLSQSFPRGDTLKFTREKRKAEARSERFRQDLRRREIILDTRINWLDLFYWTSADYKVRESRQAVAELIEVIQAIFATGRETSQDILRAELELSLLDDRLVDIDRHIKMVRAKLARRIGAAANTMHPGTSLPGMTHPSDVTVITDLLDQHPAAQIFAARVDAADKDVGIAGEQYKPGWAVNVGYGARGGDRTDMASVGLTMDVPLFTKKRQDKKLSAAKSKRQASRLSRDTVLLDLRKGLESSFADWKQLQERVALYQSVVVKRARDTTEASLTSYQSGVTDFPELVRARLAELDAELKLLSLSSDRLKAQAQLLYLEGEEDA